MAVLRFGGKYFTVDLRRDQKIALAVVFAVAVVYLAWHGGYWFGGQYSAVAKNDGIVFQINTTGVYSVPPHSIRTYSFRWGVGTNHVCVFRGSYAEQGLPASDTPYHLGLRGMVFIEQTAGGGVVRVPYQNLPQDTFNVSFEFDGLLVLGRFGFNKRGLGVTSTGVEYCGGFVNVNTGLPWNSCGVAITEYAMSRPLAPCCGSWVEHTLTVVNNEDKTVEWDAFEFLYPHHYGYFCDEVEGYTDYAWSDKEWNPTRICPIPDGSRKNGDICWWDVQCASGYCDVWATNPGRCKVITTTTTSTVSTTVSTTTIPKTTTTFPTTTTICFNECDWVGCSGDYNCLMMPDWCRDKVWSQECATHTTTPTTIFSSTTTLGTTTTPTTIQTTTTLPTEPNFLKENARYILGGILLTSAVGYILTKKPT